MTLIHEHMHWLQYVGTSVGAFHALLRASMDKTVFRFFHQMPSEAVTAILSRRKRGEPIIPLLEDGTLDDSLYDTEFNDINVFRQVWHDHLVTRTLFWDSELQESVKTDRAISIPEILGDSLLMCADLGLCEYPGNDRARTWLDLGQSQPELVRFGDKRLTTKHLLEAAATIQELHAALAGTLLDDRSLIEEVLAKLELTSYGMAYEVFELIVDFPPSQYVNSLTTLCVIIDLALNPPIPPIVVDIIQPLSWHEIYPPIRFHSLCKAVRRIGLIRHDSTSKECNDWQDKVIEMSKIADPRKWDVSHLTKALAKVDDSDTCWETHNSQSWINWFLNAANQVWNTRRSFPELITRLGECTHGELSRRAVPYFTALEGKDWFQAPFLLNVGEPIRHSYWKNFGSFLFLGLLFSDYLEEFLLGTDEPQLPYSLIDAQEPLGEKMFDQTMALMFDIPVDQWRIRAFN